MEIWKDIIGYEGSHQVSNYGNVRSLDRVDSRGRRIFGRILKPQTDKDGYFEITIKHNSIKKHWRINRLVADAFIDNPNNYPIAGHMDDDRKNNNYTNIYWTTIVENLKHNGRSKRIGDKLSIAVKGSNGIDTVIFKSITEAGKNGFRSSSISNCLAGRSTTHKGYIWSMACSS